MDGKLRQRWALAVIGAVAGALLCGLIEAVDRDLLSERLALVAMAWEVTLAGALLVMAGPMGLRRAVLASLGLAVAVAALVWAVSLRYAEAGEVFDAPLSAMAVLIVATLPIPFLISRAGPGWRHYPTLFLEAWTIVVRSAAAWAFTGVVWLVIFLSDALLSIVGVEIIQDLLEIGAVPFVITGAVLGLAMAVVHEFAELLSPYLVLRLFRLLLPVVLVVMLVFLAVLPFRGLTGLFNGLSPALVLLAMVAAGIALVSIAVDQTDAEATGSPFLRLTAQGQALILPVMAGFAGWAVWMRVVQYGWTPERLFVALLAGLALTYGVIYAGSVLLRGPWMERIRQGNLRMALAVIALATLWLTPVLNAERLSAQDQLARFEAGVTSVEALDVTTIGGWGLAGDRAIAALEVRAKEPGGEALAAHLVDPWAMPVVALEEQAAQLAALVAALPLQPASATATATRDTLLAALLDSEVVSWTEACLRRLPDGRAGCVMVVADLLPLLPGEEAIVILNQEGDYVQTLGLYLLDDGSLAQRQVLRPDGSYPDSTGARALLGEFQAALPVSTAAMINQVGSGEAGLLFLP